MVADRFRGHKSSLMKVPGERYTKLLPIAAIYGGNASGKTTFVQAIKCLRHIVVRGSSEQVEGHLFVSEGASAPTEFRCTFLASDRVFEYYVLLTKGRIEREVLKTHTKGRQNIIFDRIPGETCVVGEHVEAGCEKDALKFAMQMGRVLPESEVFIFNIMKLKIASLIDYVKPAYKWFAETLCIIEADSRRIGLGIDLLTQLSHYSNALAGADTGVEKLEFRETSANAEDLVPSYVLSAFKDSDDTIHIVPDDSSMLLVKEEDKVKVIKCYSVYQSFDGMQKNIPLSKESDGTRRYLHLLPILLDTQRDRVYVVDELNRSLHTALSRSLIRNFRRIIEGQERKLQLIFSTHDVMLMDTDNFRKDEIWVTERDESHQAHLSSFAEYKDVRPDLQMRKSYLEGRMGGLPNMSCCL